MGSRRRLRASLAILALSWVASPGPAAAQGQAAVEQERRDFTEWLRSASLSPRRAVGIFPLGDGLSLGPPSAAIPLAGVAAARLAEHDGRILLRTSTAELQLARGRAARLGRWQLLVSGPPGRTAVTVFADALKAGKQPAWSPYDPRAALLVTLVPPAAPGTLRVLAPDGVEVEATEAGTVAVNFGGRTQALRVLRLPGTSDEESELEIYFRDPSNGRTTYPAGRFVSLIPQAGNRYLLDFNRARNPFCAYNTAYPCPAPWRGNTLAVPVAAGERYAGGGLSTPPGG
jgi:uncharacterized protein (DUF1684 family)